MNYKPEVFLNQYLLVKRFVYYLAYHRELKKLYEALQLESEFWTHTSDAHLQQAVICWCMVFGSDGCNPTHWKKLSDEEVEHLQFSFRNGLLQDTFLNQAEWDLYWQEMVRFRNEYVAHRVINSNVITPYFDSAINVAYYYDKWIREIIYPDFFEEPCLQDSVSRLKKKIKPLLKKLLLESKKYNEECEPIA